MISYIQRKQIDHDRLNSLIDMCTRQNHFTNAGPVKTILENKIGELINLPHNKRVLCVGNGTLALHTLVAYYNKKAGKILKWVSPSFTFPSCISNNTNIKLVDINPHTYTLSEDDVGDADGIIITNLFGTVMDFDISRFTDKIIIFDNASSFMSSISGVNICLRGNAAFGSLHHTKTLGFGEGGFVVVDSDMYDDLQALCGFGFRMGDRTPDVNASNYKMSDVAAAYILQHMESYDIKRHYEIQKLFFDSLHPLEIFNYSIDTFYGNLPVVFKHPTSIDVFRAHGIEANKYYKPLDDHMNANNLYDRIINFPLNVSLCDDEILHMCNIIKNNS